jgi:hypothetical protein
MALNWAHLNRSGTRSRRRQADVEPAWDVPRTDGGLFLPGDRVLHEHFGVGVVVRSQTGDQGCTTASFGGEVKKIRNTHLEACG